MDLSFNRFAHDAEITFLPADLAVMMVGIAVRQATSPTAVQALRAPAPVVGLLTPPHGAFNAHVAALLREVAEK